LSHDLPRVAHSAAFGKTASALPKAKAQQDQIVQLVKDYIEE